MHKRALLSLVVLSLVIVAVLLAVHYTRQPGDVVIEFIENPVAAVEGGIRVAAANISVPGNMTVRASVQYDYSALIEVRETQHEKGYLLEVLVTGLPPGAREFDFEVSLVFTWTDSRGMERREPYTLHAKGKLERSLGVDTI